MWVVVVKTRRTNPPYTGHVALLGPYYLEKDATHVAEAFFMPGLRVEVHSCKKAKEYE